MDKSNASQVSLTKTRFKVCPACLCTKVLDKQFFHVSRTGNGRTGYTPRCKVCACLARKTYYYANVAAEKERHWEWTQKNREKVNAHARKSRNKHSEKYKERDKAWRLKNKAVILANNRARKAAIRQADREPYTGDDLLQMWYAQSGLCFYCNVPLFAHYHVEHMIPLSRGGADKLENLCLACPTCNLRKGAKTAEEFIALTNE